MSFGVAFSFEIESKISLSSRPPQFTQTTLGQPELYLIISFLKKKKKSKMIPDILSLIHIKKFFPDRLILTFEIGTDIIQLHLKLNIIIKKNIVKII